MRRFFALIIVAASLCLVLFTPGVAGTQPTLDIDHAERILEALQTKLTRLQNSGGTISNTWLAKQSNQIKAAIEQIHAEPAFLTTPIPYTVKNYNPQTGQLKIWATLLGQNQQELTFKVDNSTAAVLQTQASLALAYFLHPLLGRTLLAAVLTLPNGSRYAQALLDWPALADRLIVASIYGYCPIGRSVEQLRRQGATDIPTEVLYADFSTHLKTAVQSVPVSANSEYAALFDLANLGFDIKVNLEKNKLRKLGVSNNTLNAACASCETYQATIQSSPYEHGYNQDRQHRQNPAARQVYTLAFALPTYTPAFKADMPSTKNAAPVFLYFGSSLAPPTNIPPACLPQNLSHELNTLRDVVETIAQQTLKFSQLPNLIADLDARKSRLLKTRATKQLTEQQRRWIELASGSAYAQRGRCLEITAEQQAQALAALHIAETVVAHCQDCTPPTTRLLHNKTSSTGTIKNNPGDFDTRTITNDGRQLGSIIYKGSDLDLADLYIGRAGQSLTNLATIVGCRTFMRDTELKPELYQHLITALAAKHQAEQEHLAVTEAKKTIAAAKAQQASGHYSQAASHLELALKMSTVPVAQQLLQQAYIQLGQAIDVSSVDGAPAARALLQAREFSSELEAQLVADPKSFQGLGVFFTGKVLENVLNTGNVVLVRQGRLLVTPINPKLLNTYPLNTHITVYGRIRGEFNYAPGRSLPRIEAVWIDAP